MGHKIIQNLFKIRMMITCLTVMGVIYSSSYSLELKYIPVLPPVITNPSLGQIDLFGEGFGPPIFIVNLNNAGDTTKYEHLHIRYSVTLQFNDKGVERTQQIYEGLTDEFSIEPNEVINVSSTNFLNTAGVNNGVILRYMVYELDDLKLKDQLIAGKRLPDGTLTFSLELYPSVDQITDDNSFSHRIVNSSTVNLITPGTEIGLPPMEVSNPRPLFTWVSQLYPDIYPSGDVFELRIYEARPGISAADAILQPPIITRRLRSLTFQYPSDERQLIPGYTYYWEVIGFVKGAISSEIRSEVFSFKMASLNDSTAVMHPKHIDEVLEILRPIIGDAMVEKLASYMSEQILIDNRPISRDELSEIVNKIISGNYTADEPLLR